MSSLLSWRKLLPAVVLLAAPVLLPANNSLPPQAFVNLARSRAALQDSFADLRGRVTHLKKNQGGAKNYPIRFVISFNRETVDARLTLNGSEQHTFSRDVFLRRPAQTVSPADSLLSGLGFRIGDLAMEFLDYPVKSELGSETVKTVNCRVLELLSPDGAPVKVWIASEYLFPLKAEFYAPGSKVTGQPERTLEITGFKKIDRYYVATDIALFSPAFRTRIAFDDCKVMPSTDPRARSEFKRQ